MARALDEYGKDIISANTALFSYWLKDFDPSHLSPIFYANTGDICTPLAKQCWCDLCKVGH